MHLESDFFFLVKASKRSHAPHQSSKKCHSSDKYPHKDSVIILLTSDTFLQKH
jgi:hypothetical protein